MDITILGGRIDFNRKLSELDKFVIAFTSLLSQQKIRHVIVSGYVSILFGRNRASEDIDIIIEKLGYSRFMQLWQQSKREFLCINTSKEREAYNEYLLDGYSIRFAGKGKFIPNIELKFPKVDLDLWTLSERKEVILNGNKLFISPLELQIPFKLFLGSKKDIEDARYLYRVFEGKLDTQLMMEFNRKLKIEKAFRRYLQ